MLSILIPTYNYNVVPLVNELHKQCLECDIIFEILVYDDGSKSILNEENEKINTLLHCKFITYLENVGLSNNRNNLVKDSKYNYLLFIDGDSLIPNNEFINTYLNVLIKDFDIIYGGRIHPETIENPNQKLRWKYGKFIEDKSASIRSNDIYKTLMFNNTLIKKDVFNNIKFEPTLKNYGHEDTLLAYQISLAKLKVIHLENPVKHGNIDINTIFIEKTIFALNNLTLIHNKKLIDEDFIKLLYWHKNLSSVGLSYALTIVYVLLHKLMIKNLKSNAPSLFVFNLFKLTYFCNNNKS